jgi:Transglutaminase-like superfamily
MTASSHRWPWRLVAAVPLREWPATVAVLVVAAGVEVALRVATLPSTARLVRISLALDQAPAADTDERVPLPAWARQRLRAVHRVMRHWPFGDTCLRQALVGGQRLHRLSPCLRVGVKKEAGAVKAHAWLEIGGVSLDPTAPSAFSSLASVRALP